jgi:hypothetical protein
MRTIDSSTILSHSTYGEKSFSGVSPTISKDVPVIGGVTVEKKQTRTSYEMVQAASHEERSAPSCLLLAKEQNMAKEAQMFCIG